MNRSKPVKVKVQFEMQYSEPYRSCDLGCTYTFALMHCRPAIWVLPLVCILLLSDFVTVVLQHVEQLLRELGAEEVPFQMHYQATDLRALLQTTLRHPEKKVHSMLARIQKHMGNTSPALVAEVWPKIQSSLEMQYERLAEQMKTCYATVQLPLSPPQLNSILKSVNTTS